MDKYKLISQFQGYNAKIDPTNLPDGTLVPGSKNVLMNMAERIGVRKGYTLDGQVDATIAGITASHDYEMHTGSTRHLRAGNGKLQYRYVASAGDKWSGNTFTADQVYWIDLVTGLSTTNYNFADYWNNTEVATELLMVKGDSYIYRWSGGVTTLLSADNTAGHILVLNATPTAGGTGYSVGNILTITTGGTGGTVRVAAVSGGVVTSVTLVSIGSGYTSGAGKATTGGGANDCTVNITSVATGSITKNGTTTWAEEGFYSSTSSRSVVINGTQYTYSGGEGTTTLVGIGSDASAEPVNSVVHQQVMTNANSNTTGLPSTLSNALIGVAKNQIYIGSLTNRSVYVSKTNSFDLWNYSSPRLPGDGAVLTLDACPVAFAVQEDQMYISAGKVQWYQTAFTNSSDLTKESLTINRLKTGPRQGSYSQASTFKAKNSVIYLTNEPTLDDLGRVVNLPATPTSLNLSDPIKRDFDSYDFTDSAGIYYKNYLYLSVPREGVVRVYNLVKQLWEAPQVLPVARFSIIDGDLYGHSYSTPETFKLFDGTSDNGFPIEAVARFSYQHFGDRANRKNFNENYIEGYITANTSLKNTIRYDYQGFSGVKVLTISGSDSQIIVSPASDGSLGKSSLGKKSLAGRGVTIDETVPPKFRVVKTMPKNDFYEVQQEFSSYGEDQAWEILAYGPNAQMSTSGNNNIME